MLTVFIIMFAVMLLGVPIAYAIGAAAGFGMLTIGHVPLTIVPQTMFGMLDTFALLAVPFFILAGNLMDKGGISKKLIDLASCIVGHIRGGLGMVCILACILFGAISGSGAAASAAIGSITIPSMKEKGYDKEFAGAITAVSGPLGIIIPPSIVMVIYAMTANVSVGDMFLAGYIPGTILGIAMMAAVYLIARKKHYPAGERPTLRGFVHSFLDSIWALLMVVIIIGGIFSGLFTATEAACVAVVYALLVGMFVYKGLKPRDLPDIFKRSAATSAAVMFCVAATNVLAWLLTNEQLPQKVAAAMGAAVHSKVLILLMVNVIFLILGMILDSTPAIILAVPILLPIVTQYGVDPLHFGLITTVNLAIGMSTPPVGITLFVSSGIAGTSLTKMVRPMLPIWITMFAILMLITFIPEISLALPNLFH
ncbi:TRAP transporter large permease [Caproiciproducens sp. NJN-50]|uniref:TRAP transporter large permease n=1 Tax=Caproiciproducens sp. NJN-50 TaxID=2507162 RepID=UPI001FAB2409|nr:TRAP transporter large permease [Caproiciproducens sp. NJN-50]